MGDKGEADRCTGDLLQPLLHLRQVTVALRAIGFEILSDFREQPGDLRLSASAADPRGTACDQLSGLDMTTGQQRHEAQLHCGGITPRAGYQLGIPQTVPVELGQTVNRLLTQLGAGMGLAIPTGPQLRITQPVVRGQVNDPDPGIK